MKADIHPKYYQNITITCSCGHKIVAGSTSEKLSTELCSACHPFYTGTQKLVDTARRVDKFEARRKKAIELKEKTLAAKKQKSTADKQDDNKKKSEKTKAKTAKTKSSKTAVNKTPKKVAKKSEA